MRQRLERPVEFVAPADPAGDAAQPDDLAADRLSRQELYALQRRCLRGQCRKPPIRMPLPIVARARDAADYQAVQVAPGQRQQPARPERRRQWRKQTKRERCGAQSADDRQRVVVELSGVVVHLVGQREKRHKISRHRGERYGLPWLSHPDAGGNQDKAEREAETGEGFQPGQHRECDDRRENGCQAGADHEAHCCSVGLVGARREQDDPDRGKGDRRRAARPCGDDPEQLGRTDHDKGAPCVDQGRKPVGYAEAAAAATATDRSGRIGDQQGQPVERA